MKPSLGFAVCLCLFAMFSGLARGQGWYKYNSISKYYNLDKPHRACHEKPLEAREKNADVIFTGTIRDMEADWEHPDMQRAKVEIKRVMKGGHVLSRLPRLPVGGMVDHRRVVIVEGIGDPAICHSDARKYDTRIFLVNKASNGELRLNSSLVRITLDNIEKAEAAVNDIHVIKGHKHNVIEKVPPKTDYYQKTEDHLPNPCKQSSCLFGAQCVVNPSTGGTTCQCPDVCADTLSPVCGSDGITYGSECRLRIKSCNMQKQIDVRANKPCEMKDPCKAKVCNFGARCVASLDGLIARCQCIERCNSFGDAVGSGPVCGSDGRNYESLCHLKKKACDDMKEIQKMYDGECDPCDGYECSFNQVCQLDSSRRPGCHCGTVCPMEFKPVCGSNGKTYSSECIMKVDACKHRMEIWLLFRGECSSGNNPCHGVTCGPGGRCVVDSSNTSHCVCPHSCEPVLRPVCGSDGRTYPSKCHLQRQSCLEKQVIAVTQFGDCNTTTACTDYRCEHEAANCVIRNRRPVCVCPICSEEYQPICGSNGLTYPNECKLKSENCERQRNMTVVHKGVCDACKNKKCDFYSICENDGRNGARCVCPQKCRVVDEKVCGSDGSTYNSECELQLQSCQLQHHIAVKAQGRCDLCANVKCRFGAKCEDGRCICHYECPNLDEPVCGSDGTTYPNECVMRRAACSQDTEIEASHAGNCEETSGSGAGNVIGDCDSRRCHFGGICKPGRKGELECGCNFNCDAVRSPVCGSDGRTYGNECQMKEESCRRQTDIHIQPMDECEDIVFEELCDGKAALVDPLTGKEYSCNNGNNCPAGSYCHKLGGPGKCCSGDQASRGCVESRFGCCPDDVTPASGPHNLGCPSSSVCHCHALGANGTSCDPFTRQCMCKPGVGGLKCDRCNPNFWGLPKISEGNSGCIPCDCDVNGSMRDDCEQMTGRCVCRPGISGQKCNMCPNGKRLGMNGCADLMFNDHLNHAMACSDKRCRFGAVCQMTKGIPECICPSTCHAEDDRSMMVCGSDGQTYGSACQLRRFSCRLQKDIPVASTGSCQKSTTAPTTTVRTTLATTTPSPPFMIKSKKSRNRVIKDLTNPTNIVYNYGMLGDFCEEDKECYATGSYCKSGLCVCKNFLTPATDNMACIAERFIIPSFSGQSFLQLKRRQPGYRDIAIEIQFQPQRENGILVYTGQDASGKGDFLSLALKNGHVEFRYDLGSGAALLRTTEKVKMGMFHKVTAMRFGKDGVLKLDDGHDVPSTSPGMLQSLNLNTSIYLGFIPNMTEAMTKNVGLSVGFVGCIESLNLKSSELNVAYDLTQDSSVDIERQHSIKECGISACSSSPCLNDGKCMELDGGINFECSCPSGYFGVQCEEREMKSSFDSSASCRSNPCQHGGSCLQLDNGRFVCNCQNSYDGERCEKVLKQQQVLPMIHPVSVTTPQFHGDSFIIIRLSKTASRSLSFEIWFLPIQPDGVLLYSAQENVVRGDFLSLNLVGGYAQLRYNLGSGFANITSQTRVKLGMWNKVVMSRMNRVGSLSLNDDSLARGQSGGDKKELNLPMKIYIGGYPNEYNADSEVKSGFVGAIQKFFKDKKLVENLLSESLAAVHVTQYNGPPCPTDNNPCHNGGLCIPNLNDFECRCIGSFSGITCQLSPENVSSIHRPIAFNGRTHHRYDNIITKSGQASNKFEIKFRTEAANGLLLLIHKSDSVDGDYLAIAINGGHVQASFNLGKEKPSKLLFLSSRVTVSDGQWHNLTFNRNQRSAHLFVDHDQPTAAVIASVGAGHLETNGHLWIGGSIDTLSGLPRAYHFGFKGCIESVRVDDQSLNLVEDRDMRHAVSFCSGNV